MDYFDVKTHDIGEGNVTYKRGSDTTEVSVYFCFRRDPLSLINDKNLNLKNQQKIVRTSHCCESDVFFQGFSQSLIFLFSKAFSFLFYIKIKQGWVGGWVGFSFNTCLFLSKT